jgi:hypothetical protein
LEVDVWRYAKSNLYGAILALAVIGIISPAIANATREIQTNICGNFAAPTITSPASNLITQDDTVIVTGTGEPSLSITIIENGAPVATTIASSSGDYSISIPLSGGTNIVIAKEVNTCGSSKESSAISVQRNIVPATPTESNVTGESLPTPSATPVTSIQSPPNTLNQPLPSVENSPGFSVPVINEPLSGVIYTTSKVWVAGTAEPSSLVTIYIDDMSVAKLRASSTGAFGVMIELNEGRNSIQVEAEKDGKSAISQPTVVTYTPSKSAKKGTTPLEVVGLVTGMTVTAVAATSGGIWIVKFISARRLR